MKLEKRDRPGFALAWSVLLTALFIAGCGSREPTADDLRTVVLAQMAKTESQAGISNSEPFGTVTVFGSSPKGSSNVAYAIEIPRGRRVYKGEVLYQKGWLKDSPLQLDLRVKLLTADLHVPTKAIAARQSVQVKYRMFVHAKQPISSFAELAGRPILLALINDSLEPIAIPMGGFEGPIDPAVKRMKLKVLAGNILGVSGPVPMILTDVARFLSAGGIQTAQIEVQNVVDEYEKAFAADERRIAVVTKAQAQKFGFDKFSDLVELLIQ